MKSLTELQVKCLMDALKGNLVRQRGADPFRGPDSSNRHDGLTVASLINNGSLSVIQFNHNNYPLEVTAVKESDIIKAVVIIGKRVRHSYRGKMIDPLLVTGVAVKKGKVYMQFTSGSNFFREFESLVLDTETPGNNPQ
jgi:hypothetical protein